MSFSTGCRKCQKCGKMYLINLFDGGLCAECEKAEQDNCEECEHNDGECCRILFERSFEQKPTEKITLWGGEQFVSIETYQQVCKERDIAIEQLHELGYELGQKIEPCDDVVSRQAVLNEFYDMENLYERIKQLPPVRPLRPQEQTGHWKRISMDRYTTHAQYWYECDKCGEHNLGNTDYCPNCGARMVEPQESEDKE